ncbi:hypothetical protein HD806DRAFT_521041 [Xylariaceae sp. AK1471]|nr:hypothetical protein HD806DRAFT_521041 [Xylariaceae sp. AK1471]
MLHVNMSGRASPEPSMASYDYYAPRTEKTDIINPEREARHRPSTQPGPQWSDSQQAWYPPTYHPQYPAAFPYGINYLPHPQVATQSAPARWDGFNPFDEEEQERRKKGKELVPVVPVRNGPPPWTGYEAGYGPGTFGPVGNPLWPALLPSQREPLLPLPSLAEMGYNSKKPGKHVHHHDQWPGAERKRDFQRRPSEIKVNREIDGILTPSSGDLTVHLTMDLQEDLGDQLDEMARLSRLGHFLSAQAFFNENLKHHMDNPYVFIQYADMLLHQGDFKGLTLLKDAAMYKRVEDMSNSDELSIRRVNHELRFLRANWELMQILAKSHTLDTLSGAPDVFAEAVGILHDLAITDDPNISSTEIYILALILRLTGHPVLNSKWLRYGSKALNAFPTSLSRLYPALLRQGRIWDLHDLVVLMPTIEDIKALTFDIFEKDLIPSFETIVSDWLDSVHGYDSSTTLALLSMMTHIILNPIQASEDDCIAILKLCLPLAISVMENDPSNLKSRPYLRLLLAKSRFAEIASRRAIDSLTSHLQSSPGVCYHPEIASLPVYVPSGNETPEWTPTDQPTELADPVRLVLRSAVELGDLETEVLARQELIRLSSDPRDDMNKLFSLQLSRQGDLNGYSLSLASKYLVATTRQAKEELSISISRLLSRVASTDYWSPSREWILNMILYKLEGRSPSTILHMLERSDSNYQYMDESLLQEISRKMSALKDWADSQVGSRPETERKVSVLQPGPVSRRNNKPSARRGKSVATPRTVEKPRARTQPSVVDEPQVEPETPLMTAAKPNNNLQDRHIPQHRPSPTVSGHVSTGGPQPMQPQVNNGHEEDARLVAKIKAKLEAEFNQRIEDEKESERERREERMAMLEGLKKRA